MTDLKLICVDMDGTFLNHSMDYNRPRFERLRTIMNDRGIKFAVASGNQYEQLKSFFDNPDELIFIAENGTYIKDKTEVLFEAVIDPDIIEVILSTLKPHTGSFCISTPNMAYAPHGDPNLDSIEPYYFALTLLDDVTHIRERVNKISVIVEEADAPALIQQLNQRMNGQAVAVYSGFKCIDIMPANNHKGHGVDLICRRYGIQRDQVIAFGDNDNDAEMLAYAGISYAMETGSPKVKAIAKFVAPSNQKDGVNTILEAYLVNRSV